MAAPMSVDFTKLFTRNLELRNGAELALNQSETGDVGCVVWDAALVLCKYLETTDFDHGAQLKEKTVLELGAGTGAVGLLTSCYGAHAVITDLEEFVPLMELNIQENKEQITGSCAATTLKWGDVQTMKDLMAEKFAAGLDFLLLADCVYYDESLDPLVETIIKLSSSHTCVLCSYEDRDLGNKAELQRRFFKSLGEMFDTCEIPKDRQDPEFSSPDIHIMELRLKQGR